MISLAQVQDELLRRLIFLSNEFLKERSRQLRSFIEPSSKGKPNPIWMYFFTKIFWNVLHPQREWIAQPFTLDHIVCSIFAGLNNKNIAIPLGKNTDFF